MLYKKIGGNNNYPNSLNVMVNYHYHGTNRVTTQQFPSMDVTIYVAIFVVVVIAIYVDVSVSMDVAVGYCHSRNSVFVVTGGTTSTWN